MSSQNNRLSRSPVAVPQQQVALQVAPQLMNDIQLISYIAAVASTGNPRKDVATALDIVAEAFVAYDTGHGLNNRVEALKKRQFQEAEEAEMVRRAELAKQHPTIQIP